jgi:pyridoxamine 5'-phosphate oxidase
MTSDPIGRLAELIEEARRRGVPEPEAMALATATPKGAPSVRVVLCRGIDERGLRFFTNYESRKGAELSANPQMAAVFFWPALDVQVRVEGIAERLTAAESDNYFSARPRGHRLSAWVSAQSRPIGDSDVLRSRARALTLEYEGRDVERPPYWGGYLLRPSAIEIWTRGADRLHERVLFERRAAGWTMSRLAP